MFDLSRISLFNGLSSDELSVIQQLMHPLSIAADQLIIKEGEISSNLYLIESGSLKVFISNDKGNQFELNTLHSGDYFGEFSFLDNATRTASVMSKTTVKLFEIKNEDFTEILKRYPSVYLLMIKNLVATIRHKDETIQQLAISASYPYLKSFLQEHHIIENRRHKKREHLTAEKIASLINCHTDIIAYLLSLLEDNNYISIDGDTIYSYKTLPDNINELEP